MNLAVHHYPPGQQAPQPITDRLKQQNRLLTEVSEQMNEEQWKFHNLYFVSIGSKQKKWKDISTWKGKGKSNSVVTNEICPTE